MPARLAAILSVLALALALGVPRADARCAARGLQLAALTPLERPIPSGGGILLALQATGDHRASALPPTSTTIGTEGMAGGAITLLETLAPGLYRVPLGSMAPGRHALRGLWPAEAPFTLAPGALPPVPPAPEVAAIEVEQRGRAGTRSRATMRRPVPPSVVAIVVIGAGAAGPIGYALPTDRSAPSLLAFGRCDRRPDGSRHPLDGEAIVLRYVDAHARLSAPSAPIVARVR